MTCAQASRISAVGRAIRACYSCRLFSAQLTYSQQQTYCIYSRSFFLLITKYLPNAGVQYYFLMTAISFLMALRASGNLSERRSLDPTEGKSREKRSSKLFMCSRMAMLPYLDDAKHF